MAASERKSDGLWETVKTVFWALVIAMAFRSILYQPFSIPSGSMKPTLLVGDYLFVSKFAYGYSKHSLPFSPDLFDGRIWGDLPERGDVVVFKKPGEDVCSEGPITFFARIAANIVSISGLTRYRAGPGDCTDYIKRVVGLPGDKVQMIDGVVHINGQRVGMEQAPDIPDPDAQPRRGTHFIEELPGGVRHSILDTAPNHPYDNTDVIEVKPGHVLFLGDNRDNSQDSRYADVGQVPLENLIGRADIVALSSAGAFWEIWEWRTSRFFKSID